MLLLVTLALAEAPLRVLAVEGEPTRDAPAALRDPAKKPAWSVELVAVPAGTFLFGALPGEGRADDPPAREVRVESFWIADVETPWGLFKQFCEPTESAYWPEPTWTCPEAGKDGLPVAQVSWWEAAAFCNWLTLRTLGATEQVYVFSGEGATRTVEVHPERKGYRMPTEIEWEWAARSGNKTAKYGSYDLPSWGCDYANTPYASCMNGTADVFAEASPVRPPVDGKGAFKANAWGIYQMSGNVQEWTTDFEINAKNTALYVIKGGSWDLGSVVVGSGESALKLDAGWVTYRLSDLPTRERLDHGFRLARTK